MGKYIEEGRCWKSAPAPAGARRQKPKLRYRHWCLRQPRSLGFFLNGLGPFFLAVFFNQAVNVALGDAEGFGFGLGYGLDFLPVLLGGQALEAFPNHAAEAAISGFGQAFGQLEFAGWHGDGHGFCGSHN